MTDTYEDLEYKYKLMLKLYSDAGEEIKKLKEEIAELMGERDGKQMKIDSLEEENKKLKKQLSDEQLYNKLCEIDNSCGNDTEARHVEADELLIECLRTLGFNKAMDKYKGMEFRYS